MYSRTSRMCVLYENNFVTKHQNQYQHATVFSSISLVLLHHLSHLYMVDLLENSHHCQLSQSWWIKVSGTWNHPSFLNVRRYKAEIQHTVCVIVVQYSLQMRCCCFWGWAPSEIPDPAGSPPWRCSFLPGSALGVLRGETRSGSDWSTSKTSWHVKV